MCQSQGHSVFGEQRQEQEPRSLAVCCSWMLWKTAQSQCSWDPWCKGPWQVLVVTDFVPVGYCQGLCPIFILQVFNSASPRGQPVFKGRAVFHLKWKVSETPLHSEGELCFLPMNNSRELCFRPMVNSNTEGNWLRTSGAYYWNATIVSIYRMVYGSPPCTGRLPQLYTKHKIKVWLNETLEIWVGSSRYCRSDIFWQKKTWCNTNTTRRALLQWR